MSQKSLYNMAKSCYWHFCIMARSKLFFYAFIQIHWKLDSIGSVEIDSDYDRANFDVIGNLPASLLINGFFGNFFSDDRHFISGIFRKVSFFGNNLSTTLDQRYQPWTAKKNMKLQWRLNIFYDELFYQKGSKNSK